MSEEPFSVREGFRPESESLPHDELPTYIRQEVFTSLYEICNSNDQTISVGEFGGEIYLRFKPWIYRVLDREAPRNPMGGPWAFYIPRVMEDAQWWQFYDILELLLRLIDNSYGRETGLSFHADVNGILQKEGVPWRVNANKVTRDRPAPIQQQISAANALLSNPRYAQVDEQFRKAIDFLDRRPNPDLPNAVKDAVGAIEGLARIISNSSSGNLNALINDQPIRDRIHPALRQSIEKLYAYRGDVGGAAHSNVSAHEVSDEDAEFVIGMTASTLILLSSSAAP